MILFSVAAVEMSRSDYMPLYLGPVTVVGQRLGDRFEVKQSSFEFRCSRADLQPKTKTKFGPSLMSMHVHDVTASVGKATV